MYFYNKTVIFEFYLISSNVLLVDIGIFARNWISLFSFNSINTNCIFECLNLSLWKFYHLGFMFNVHFFFISLIRIYMISLMLILKRLSHWIWWCNMQSIVIIKSIINNLLRWAIAHHTFRLIRFSCWRFNSSLSAWLFLFALFQICSLI